MLNGISGNSSSYSGFISDADTRNLSISEKRSLIRSGQLECETCKTRKYQDGSNEMVSFKSPTHISPESAPAAVRAHEQEHVSNAYNKAAKAEHAQVINASVSIQTSVCPECGRTYVSGGETTTQIKYHSDSYAQNSKRIDQTYLPGQNIEETV